MVASAPPGAMVVVVTARVVGVVCAPAGATEITKMSANASARVASTARKMDTTAPLEPRRSGPSDGPLPGGVEHRLPCPTGAADRATPRSPRPFGIRSVDVEGRGIDLCEHVDLHVGDAEHEHL